MPLPVEDIFPQLFAAWDSQSRMVLVAPPGAGKTTRLPLALLERGLVPEGQRLLLLEPRRVAARAAAGFMARQLGEPLGRTVGLTVRLESRTSAATRIEVVTEGVLTRRLLRDPGLEGVAGILFDEYHERSLDADLGLALALDAQDGLRPDLRLLVMSATLEEARVARLLGDAPVLESAGRAFPVTLHHRPRAAHKPLPEAAAEAVLAALHEVPAGDILVFLPGQGEIRGTERRLVEGGRLPATVDLLPLHGQLEPAAQDAALAAAPSGRRKVILSTAIAETSLTVDGLRIVIDAGQSRVARFDPVTGANRLETVKTSRATATQRAGRAGRQAPGHCYRLWEEEATRALPPFAEPEILQADLAPLLLVLADWGVADPAALRWLDPPPAAAVADARARLQGFGALDGDGRLTPHGRRMAELPLDPQLAHLVLHAAERGQGQLAALLAVLAGEQGLGGRSLDAVERLDGLLRDSSPRARAARQMAARWARTAGASEDPPRAPVDAAEVAHLLAAAWPQRIGRSRGGAAGEFQLASGRGAVLDPAHRLAAQRFIVALDLTGSPRAARVQSAVALDEADLPAAFVTTAQELRFDAASRSVRGRRVQKLLALTLSSDPLDRAPDAEAAAEVLVQGIRSLGLDALPWSPFLRRLRARLAFLAAQRPDEGWPDMADAALLDGLEDWLGPWLAGKTRLSELTADSLGDALQAATPPELWRQLDRLAPDGFHAPSGVRLAIDYAAETGPGIAARVQDFYGQAEHPRIAGGRYPLTLTLLSPADRPVQVTQDLPGFWAGSYRQVRGEMKGRYPRHAWPEDPLEAPATRASLAAQRRRSEG